MKKDWASWTTYHQCTSSRLVTATTHEKCDCMRQDTGGMIENRMFEDTEMNFTVSYFQFFEGVPSRGILRC